MKVKEVKTGRYVVWWAGAWGGSSRCGSVLPGGGEPCQFCEHMGQLCKVSAYV
jgi:hypothetical protein